MDYPTLGLDPYDILSTYGSLAGDLPPNFPAHCQPVWCRNICAKQTPHSTMRVPAMSLPRLNHDSVVVPMEVQWESNGSPMEASMEAQWKPRKLKVFNGV